MNSLIVRFSVIVRFLIVFLLLYCLHGLTPKLNAVDLVDFDLGLEVAALSSSNIFRQIMWVFYFWISLALLLSVSKRWVYLFTVKYLASYVFLVFLVFFSFVYSDYYFLSIKRSALFVVSSFVIFSLVYLGERDFYVLDLFLYCFVAVFCLDLLAVLFFNGIGSDGFFRGIHGQKNIAGSIYSYFFVYFVGRIDVNKLNFDMVFSLLSLLFLLMSGSKTAIAIVFLFFVIWKVDYLYRNFMRISIVMFSLLTVFYFLGLYDIPGDVLTGRGFVWEFIRIYSSDFMIHGFGFGSFWGVGESSRNLLSDYYYIQLINTAHNGYVDVILSGGCLLLLFLCLHLLLNIRLIEYTRSYKYSFFCGFVFFSLVFSNVTESSFFLTQSPTWVIYLVSFFCLLNYYFYTIKKGS